jgi:hypothetical protein
MRLLHCCMPEPGNPFFVLRTFFRERMIQAFIFKAGFVPCSLCDEAQESRFCIKAQSQEGRTTACLKLHYHGNGYHQQGDRYRILCEVADSR